jgi:hypothetical protein
LLHRRGADEAVDASETLRYAIHAMGSFLRAHLRDIDEWDALVFAVCFFLATVPIFFLGVPIVLSPRPCTRVTDRSLRRSRSPQRYSWPWAPRFSTTRTTLGHSS